MQAKAPSDDAPKTNFGLGGLSRRRRRLPNGVFCFSSSCATSEAVFVVSPSTEGVAAVVVLVDPAKVEGGAVVVLPT